MNWKIGQKLVYIGIGMRNIIGQAYGPKNGEIVTYDGPSIHIPHRHIYLVEYKNIFYAARASFACEYFRPILGDSAKDELIASFTEVTETSDLPIKSPQTV